MFIRLYVDHLLEDGATVALTPEQAHYLRNVMRRDHGDEVHAFNARDGEFSATITNLSKKGGSLKITDVRRLPRKESDLWLLFAPLKRSAVDTIAQKATELGIAALMPVVTARTNASRINLDRISAISIEASEQCERLSVPNIMPSVSLAAILEDWQEDRTLIFCDEAGDDPKEPWGGPFGRAEPMGNALRKFGGQSGKMAILIGPEGGFTTEERDLLREKTFVLPVTLGPRILRADTAALVAIALWQALIGDSAG